MNKSPTELIAKTQTLRPMVKKVLPWFFLGYGLYYAFDMRRDFAHTELLSWSLIALFLLLLGLFGLEMYLRHAKAKGHDKWTKHAHFIRASGIWSFQSLLQYLLMFCWPFFLFGDHYGYFGIMTIFVACTLWDDWWNRLFEVGIFRQSIMLFTALSVVSFIWPFFLPDYLDDFYHGLAAVGLTVLILNSWHRGRRLSGLGLLAAMVISVYGLPMQHRFPMLSVWLEKPHFEIQYGSKWDGPFPSVTTQEDLHQIFKKGGKLCCVVPVVAPPGVRQRITMQWLLEDRIIEKPLLKRAIVGNQWQKAFRTYYCKKNFPELPADSTITCAASFNDRLYMGDVALEIAGLGREP